jgi:hypothetical protein
MPRYSFHVRDGEDMPDHEGSVLAGPAEARVEAVPTMREMLRDSGGRRWTGTEWTARDEMLPSCKGVRFPRRG